jgi:RHS repeat-associated protein
VADVLFSLVYPSIDQELNPAVWQSFFLGESPLSLAEPTPYILAWIWCAHFDSEPYKARTLLEAATLSVMFLQTKDSFLSLSRFLVALDPKFASCSLIGLVANNFTEAPVEISKTELVPTDSLNMANGVASSTSNSASSSVQSDVAALVGLLANQTSSTNRSAAQNSLSLDSIANVEEPFGCPAALSTEDEVLCALGNVEFCPPGVIPPDPAATICDGLNCYPFGEGPRPWNPGNVQFETCCITCNCFWLEESSSCRSPNPNHPVTPAPNPGGMVNPNLECVDNYIPRQVSSGGFEATDQSGILTCDQVAKNFDCSARRPASAPPYSDCRGSETATGLRGQCAITGEELEDIRRRWQNCMGAEPTRGDCGQLLTMLDTDKDGKVDIHHNLFIKLKEGEAAVLNPFLSITGKTDFLAAVLKLTGIAPSNMSIQEIIDGYFNGRPILTTDGGVQSETTMGDVLAHLKAQARAAVSSLREPVPVGFEMARLRAERGFGLLLDGVVNLAHEISRFYSWTYGASHDFAMASKRERDLLKLVRTGWDIELAEMRRKQAQALDAAVVKELRNFNSSLTDTDLALIAAALNRHEVDGVVFKGEESFKTKNGDLGYRMVAVVDGVEVTLEATILTNNDAGEAVSGDPVSMQSGQVVYEAVDATLSSSAGSFALTRYYNGGGGTQGWFGRNITSVFDEALYRYSDIGGLLLRQETSSGAVNEFIYDSSAPGAPVYRGTRDNFSFARMINESEAAVGRFKGGIEVRANDGTTSVYCPASYGMNDYGSAHKLRAVIQPDGRLFQIIWSKDGRPDYVVDGGGNKLQVEIDPKNPRVISAIATPNDGVITYNYHSPNDNTIYHEPTLKEVLRSQSKLILFEGALVEANSFEKYDYLNVPLAERASYQTAAAFVNAKLTKIIKGSTRKVGTTTEVLGQEEVTYQYHPPGRKITEGRVATMTEPGGPVTSYAYEEPVELIGSGYVEVTEVQGVNTPAPLTQKFRYNDEGLLVSFTKGLGVESYQLKYEYIKNTNLLFNDTLVEKIIAQSGSGNLVDKFVSQELQYLPEIERQKFRFAAGNVQASFLIPGNERGLSVPSFVSFGLAQPQITSFVYEPISNKPRTIMTTRGTTEAVYAYELLPDAALMSSRPVTGWAPFLRLDNLRTGRALPALESRLHSSGLGRHGGIITSPAIEYEVPDPEFGTQGRPYVYNLYDERGRKLSTVNTTGVRTDLYYNQSESAPYRETKSAPGEAAITTTYQYTPRGELISAVDALGISIRNNYDSAGQLLETVTTGLDGVSYVSQRFYDSLGRLTGESLPLIRRAGETTGAYQAGYSPTLEYINTFAGENLKKSILNVYSSDRIFLHARSAEQIFGANGRVLSATSPDGQRLLTKYNSRGEEIGSESYDRLGVKVGEVTFDLSPNGLPLRVTVKNRLGVELQLSQARYDGLDREILKYEELRGVYSVFDIDSTGWVDQSREYSPTGDLLSKSKMLASPSGLLKEIQKFNFVYNPDGSAQAVGLDPIRTIFNYDVNGQVTKTISDAEGANVVESNIYDGYGRLSLNYQDKNRAATEVKFTYDALGRQASIERSFDALGTAGPVNPSRTTLRYVYNNPLGLLSEVVYPVGGSRRLVYDLYMRQIGEISPAGIEQRVVANSLGEPEHYLEISRTGQAIKRAAHFDTKGDLVSQTDSRGNVTSYQYDSVGRMVAEISPGGRVTSSKYDDWGRQIEVQEPDANLTFVYDSYLRLSKLTAKGRAADVVREFVYPNLWSPVVTKKEVVTGRDLVSATQQQTNFSPPLAQILNIGTERYVQQKTVDKVGRVTRLIYPSGSQIKVDFNDKGENNSIALLNGPDSVSPLYQLTESYGQGVKKARLINRFDRVWSYDALARPVADSVTNNLAEVNFISYIYDRNSNLSATSRNRKLIQTAIYGYDDFNRLSSAAISDYQSRRLSWNYDDTNNWLTHSDSRKGNFLNKVKEDNSYLTFGGSAPNYTPSASLSNYNGLQIEWDALNRPYSLKQGASSLAFTYNPDNQLVRVSGTGVSGGTETVLYDAGVVSALRDGAGVWSEFVRTPGGIVNLKNSAPESISLSDYFLNIIAVLKANGSVDRYSYDPYGARTAAPTNSASFPPGNLGFMGLRHLPAFANSYVVTSNRLYSTSMGRFLSPDPARADPQGNLFSFPGSNPFGVIDPAGLGPTELPDLTKAANMHVTGNLVGVVERTMNQEAGWSSDWVTQTTYIERMKDVIAGEITYNEAFKVAVESFVNNPESFDARTGLREVGHRPDIDVARQINKGNGLDAGIQQYKDWAELGMHGLKIEGAPVSAAFYSAALGALPGGGLLQGGTTTTDKAFAAAEIVPGVKAFKAMGTLPFILRFEKKSKVLDDARVAAARAKGHHAYSSVWKTQNRVDQAKTLGKIPNAQQWVDRIKKHLRDGKKPQELAHKVEHVPNNIMKNVYEIKAGSPNKGRMLVRKVDDDMYEILAVYASKTGGSGDETQRINRLLSQ